MRKFEIDSQVPAKEIFYEEFEGNVDMEKFVEKAEKELGLNLINKDGKRPLNGFVTSIKKSGKTVIVIHKYLQDVAKRKGRRGTTLPKIKAKKPVGNAEKLRKSTKGKKADVV